MSIETMVRLSERFKIVDSWGVGVIKLGYAEKKTHKQSQYGRSWRASLFFAYKKASAKLVGAFCLWAFLSHSLPYPPKSESTQPREVAGVYQRGITDAIKLGRTCPLRPRYSGKRVRILLIQAIKEQTSSWRTNSSSSRASREREFNPAMPR